MTATQLLAAAREQGVRLEAQGEKLAVRGPASAVCPLLPGIQAQKAALLALLRAGPPGSTVATPDAPSRCHACWCYFPEAQLTVVQETLGRGFRCPRCLAGGG